MTRIIRSPLILAGTALALTCTLTGLAGDAYAAATGTPTLVITNQPLPPSLSGKVYTKPSKAPEVSPSQVTGASYYQPTNTIVGRKLDELQKELFSLQGDISGLSENLAGLENDSQNKAATYYADIATISTQLQSGTTPGNPRLVQRLGTAQQNLEQLADSVSRYNDIAVDVSRVASVASFLLESARATYGLSGAVEEDHVRLAQLEDSINNTIVIIDRLLNNVNDDITRTSTYLATERSNLRTLSLAVANGDLYGKSLSSRPFSSARPYGQQMPDAPMMQDPAAGGPMAASSMSAPMQMAPAQAQSRPLVKIRFDKSDVSYEQPMYMAVNEAMERYPNSRFELVAVHPTNGNAAQVAIESSRARRNAERVLRTLTQMGVPLDRVDLSYAPSTEATTNEVHLYLR